MTRSIVVAVAALLALASVAACDVERALPAAPAHARAADETRLADRLRGHLRAVPGVADATLVVHLPVDDPFARTPAPPRARVAAVVTPRPGADPALLRDAAAAAARALAGPDVDLAIDVAAPPPAAPPLVSVGPFAVAAGSRTGLLATLALALATIATLAALLAWSLARRRPPR